MSLNLSLFISEIAEKAWMGLSFDINPNSNILLKTDKTDMGL